MAEEAAEMCSHHCCSSPVYCSGINCHIANLLELFGGCDAPVVGCAVDKKVLCYSRHIGYVLSLAVFHDLDHSAVHGATLSVLGHVHRNERQCTSPLRRSTRDHTFVSFLFAWLGWGFNADSATSYHMRSWEVVDLPDPAKEEARKETHSSGHGVSVSKYWRQRHPMDVSAESIQEDQYMLKECVTGHHKKCHPAFEGNSEFMLPFNLLK